MLFWYGVDVFKNKSYLKVRSICHPTWPPLRNVSERAISYSNRATSFLLGSTFEAWTRRRNILQNNLILVDKHYAASLLSRVFLIWRLRLRATLKLEGEAKMARRYFVERGAWDRWLLILEKKRRSRKVQDLERARLKRVFLSSCALLFHIR